MKTISFKRKWIKGECRHFCFLCVYYATCKAIENKYPSPCGLEYYNGFDAGYKVGYEAAITAAKDTLKKI